MTWRKAEWLPKPAPAIERPADLPASVAITAAPSRDPGPSHWTKIKSGQHLAQAGIYDSRFIFYRPRVSSPTATNLLVEYPDGDAVLATINGRPATRIGGTGGSSVFDLPAGASSGVALRKSRPCEWWRRNGTTRRHIGRDLPAAPWRRKAGGRLADARCGQHQQRSPKSNPISMTATGRRWPWTSRTPSN